MLIIAEVTKDRLLLCEVTITNYLLRVKWNSISQNIQLDSLNMGQIIVFN